MILENFVNELGKNCRMQLRGKLKTWLAQVGWEVLGGESGMS